ncbi:MAG: hypothetical protein KC502_13840 [Myxococcales bacterium]|nr:hypothetical protein [Myxococcales bacterium]
MTAPQLRASATCVEARGLALGLRQAWRLRLPRASLKPWQRAWRRHGLFLTASSTAFRDVPGGLLVPAADGERGVHLVVLSTGKELARACLAAELENAARGAASSQTELQRMHAAHRAVGAAYGYPPCCVAAFCDAHAEAILARKAQRSGDEALIQLGDNGLAIARAAARTQHFDPRLAALPGALGERNVSTLRHLPCRFDCPASITLAEALLADVAATDERRFLRLRDGLRAPIWMDTAGHAHVAQSAQMTGAQWRVTLSDGSLVHAPIRQQPGKPVLPVLLPFHL